MTENNCDNNNNRLVLISGRSNTALAEDMASSIGEKLCAREVTNFSDGEIFVQIKENVRGADVFVVQSTSSNVNDNLMELLIIIDAARRASAKRITAVLPYFGYARQDRKVQSRTPITAKLVADLITAAGTDRVLSMDLHAGQIQGFFSLPVDHLYAAPILTEYIKKHYDLGNLVVFSPDAGGVERARAFAKSLGTGLGIIDKRREAKNVAQVMHIIGEVKGRDVLVVDDMVDTAGTLTEAVAALYKAGANTVSACCTHAVLSGPAIDRLERSQIKDLITSNTIALGEKKLKCGKIKALSVARLLGEAILRIHQESSVSSLFEY
ncbi:MAG: ribose-phosphate pyrophosphokinase [Nitrospinae bacterium]|nr:ribose-phosphate pyrophosphokinase [Nitrospinota bacterium]